MAGDYGFVAQEGGYWFASLDLTDPDTCHQLDTSAPATSEGVALYDHYAYATAGGLAVVDILHPDSLVYVTEVPGAGMAGIAIAGHFAYTVAGTQLHIFDLTDPALPVHVSDLDAFTSATGVAACDTLVYVAGAELSIVNTANPSSPTVIGACPISGGYSRDVALSSHYAFVAAYASGLRVIDVANPAAPVEVGYYDTPGSAYGVAARANIAYVADHATSGYFGVYEFTPEAQPRLHPDTLAFGGVYVDSSAAQFFWGVNTGPDTIFVNYMTSDNPAFEDLTLWSPSIIPGDSALGSIGFTPAAQQEYLAHFTIYSDHGIQVLTCTGRGIIGNRVEQSGSIPTQFALCAAYPNPFNATATIVFDLPVSARISLGVCDLLGRQVAVLKDGLVEAGIHRVTFDGSHLVSGIYFARLEAGEFVQTRKMMLLK